MEVKICPGCTCNLEYKVVMWTILFKNICKNSWALQTTQLWLDRVMPTPQWRSWGTWWGFSDNYPPFPNDVIGADSSWWSRAWLTDNNRLNKPSHNLHWGALANWNWRKITKQKREAKIHQLEAYLSGNRKVHHEMFASSAAVMLLMLPDLTGR